MRLKQERNTKKLNKIMDWEIGEIKQINGEWYQCVEEIGCGGCAFNAIKCNEIGDIVGNCTVSLRHDDKPVVFKKLEKVGEPYACRNMPLGRYGIIVQRYKVFAKPIFTDDSIRRYNSINKTILIALNNKEDMEEKKLNLKPFDLRLAKSGKPVCTRDGRPARIICFDAKCADTPIVALVPHKNEEESLLRYYRNGKFRNDKDSGADLMMLPGKRTGWINIYPQSNIIHMAEAGKGIYPTEAVAKLYAQADCIATVPVEWEE